MRKSVLIITILVAVAVSRVFSAGGTDIFPLLKINPSSVGSGLGGVNGIASSQMSLNSGACIPWTTTDEISFQYLSYLAESSLNLITYSKLKNEKSGYAFSFGYFAMGGLEKTKYDPSPGNIDGYVQTGSFLYSNYLAAASYGIKLDYDLSAGIGVKVVNETIESNSNTGFMCSVSALYLPDSIPWQFGMGINNIGPKSSGYSLPTVGYLSAGKRVRPELFWIGELDNYMNHDVELKTGFEYLLTDLITVRMGYRNPVNSPGIGSFLDYNLTAGFGLKFKSFSCDYAWVPYGEFGNTHRLSVTAKFGEEKGETYTSRLKEISGAAKPDSVTMAVSNLTGKNIPDTELVQISEFLRSELSKMTVYDVMDKDQMNKMFSDKNVPIPLCYDEKCAAILGRILGVSRVVIGKVSKFMGTYRITVTMVNVDTGAAIKTVSQDETDYERVKEACWMIAQRLRDFTK